MIVPYGSSHLSLMHTFVQKCNIWKSRREMALAEVIPVLQKELRTSDLQK